MRVFKPQATKPIPKGAKISEAKRVVTYKVRGKTRRAILTDKGRMRIETRTWHIEFKDHHDRKQRIVAFAHEAQSRLLASYIEKLISYHGGPVAAELQDSFDRLPNRIVMALEACGLLEREQTPLVQPLAELLSMFEETLRARGRSEQHIRQTISMATEVFSACGFAFWREIRDHRVEAYLRELREGERHLSYGRSNAYLQACHGFCNWVVNERKWARESPLRGLRRLNAKEDPRHQRRAISVDQLRTLLQTTARGPERFGMSGKERYLLYRFVVETGLRRDEIQRLRKADFDFEAQTVTVRPKKASKNRRRKEQSISPGLHAELQDFLSNKLPDAKAFGGRYTGLTHKTAAMLREDLADAGIPYKDDRGDVFDFHALRGECASLLIDSGIDPKLTQEIMRHSSISLTMDVYARLLGNRKKAEAVARLPDLSLSGARQQITGGSEAVCSRSVVKEG